MQVLFGISAACCNNALVDVMVSFVRIDGFEKVCVGTLKTILLEEPILKNCLLSTRFTFLKALEKATF